MDVQRRKKNADQRIRLRWPTVSNHRNAAIGWGDHYVWFFRDRTGRVAKEESHEGGDKKETDRDLPVAKEKRQSGKHQGYCYEWNSVANHVWSLSWKISHRFTRINTD